MDFSQMLNWAKDISLGVNYLHREAPCKVIHRDLKSKNVVISRDNYTLKLCDFGASRYLAQTATMTLVGTFPWMAPELIQGLKSNELCDTYSFGVLLWEMLTREVPFRGMEGFQVAWMVVEKKQRPPIPESTPEPLRQLISNCWDQDPKNRNDFLTIIQSLDDMANDDDLITETNSFMGNKDEWELEYESAVDSMKTEQHSSIKEREEAVAERENKVREWETAQREQAKNHSFYGVAVLEESSFSKNFKFSGTGAGAGENLLAMIESVSGVSLPQRDIHHRALTRGASGSSLTSGTPGTDEENEWNTKVPYGSNASLSSISSAPGLSTVKSNPLRHKRSVGTPPLSPLAGEKFFSPMINKHMMPYTPKKTAQPLIEGEAHIGGNSRKTSVGIVGAHNPQTIALPKELEDLLANPTMKSSGKPCYKYSRQKSTSNEYISYNDVRTIVKGPPGTEPQGQLYNNINNHLKLQI